MVKVRVPATTANLGPGFDCLGMALDIYNYVTLERIAGGGVEILAEGSATDSSIPLDDSNLVFRAVKRAFEYAGEVAEGLRLTLETHAPLARGLGSSASAITGGIVAANELLGRPMSPAEVALEVTAMEGHPDNVIPCLVGGLTASIALQDRVIYEKISPAANVRCVVFIPDYELETAHSRAVMPQQVSMQDAVFNSARIPFVLARLADGHLDDLSVFMDDRLHQPYRIPLIKGFESVASAARQAGAAAVCISGAGPTILAVCEDSVAVAVKEAGARALLEHDVKADSRIVTPDVEGCIIVS